MDILDSCLDPTSRYPLPTTITTTTTATTTVDDLCDSTVTLETTHIQQGFTDGYNSGLISGRQDGHLLGLKHGFTSGEELGFYHGLVHVWTAAINAHPNCFPSRTQKNILHMRDLIEKYPLMEPEDEGRDEIVEGFRLKFRAVSASLGVKLEYDGYPKGSDSNDIEF